MSPAPSKEKALDLLSIETFSVEPETALLTAASLNLLTWDPNPGSIEVRNPINPKIEHSGVYTYPQFVRERQHLVSIGFGNWGPITQYSAAREVDQMRDFFGVKLNFKMNYVMISTTDNQYNVNISLNSNGDIWGDQRKVFSALMLVPPENWSTAQKSGIVHLEDPAYVSAPLVMGLYLPDKSGLLQRSWKTEEYVANRGWEATGKPLVVYGTY